MLSRPSVASRPNILQNNLKPDVEKNCLQSKICGRRPPFLGKSGRKLAKNFLGVESWFLRGVFTSKCEFVTTNFQKYYLCQHLIFTLNRYK
jgi:hypothetical protein